MIDMLWMGFESFFIIYEIWPFECKTRGSVSGSAFSKWTVSVFIKIYSHSVTTNTFFKIKHVFPRVHPSYDPSWVIFIFFNFIVIFNIASCNWHCLKSTDFILKMTMFVCSRATTHNECSSAGVYPYRHTMNCLVANKKGLIIWKNWRFRNSDHNLDAL